MRRFKPELTLLSIVLIFVALQGYGRAQVDSLQVGTPVKKTIGRGQQHRFSVALQADEFAQVIVDQFGIDVVVRVISPQGKVLGEFDSPNGTIGPETVSIVATTAGTYSVDVFPLSQSQDIRPGSFEIRLAALRRATPPELQAAKTPEIAKARGVALLNAVLQTLPEVRSVQTRIRAQIQIAGLLQTVDETLVRRLVNDATAGIQEFKESARDSEDEFQRYNTLSQLRNEALQVIGQLDPELALTFIRSTRLPEDYTIQYMGQADPDIGLELNLAMKIGAKDPGRAVQIAEDTLVRGHSAMMGNVVTAVRNSNPALASRLAKATAAKLQEGTLLSSADAGNAAISLLRIAYTPSTAASARRNGIAPLVDVPLLSEQEFQSLLTNVLTQALSFTPAPENPYSQEMNAARNILNGVKSMPAEAHRLSAANMATIEEKLQQLAQANPRDRFNQTLSQEVNKAPVDRALQMIAEAPREMRDSLYQQLAQRVAREGDLNRGRQILNEGMSNAQQRRNALNNLERQGISDAVNKGRFDDAVRGLVAIRSTNERVNMISSLLGQVERGQKKDVVLSFLDQLRTLLGTSAVAENQNHMNALLQIAAVFSRQGSTRGFEIVEPLLDQFNELSAAASTLSGFGQEYYKDGELSLGNGNNIGQLAVQLTQTIGGLALTDFDRARQDVDRLRRPEVRLAGYIAMARQTINPPPLRW